MKRLLLCLPLLLILASCSGMPKLFWDVDEGRDQPAYASSSASASEPAGKRAPLDVPPELRSEIELPGAADIASSGEEDLPEKYRRAVAGRAVSLHAKVYEADAATLFSAVVDAMTALNIPVDSVDSPSGVITSDWIRKGAHNTNMFGGIFGGLSGSNLTKHRFIVRVYRMKSDAGPRSKLEIRVLGQVYDNGHWVNKPFRQDVSKELFASVEEQLARLKPQMKQHAPATKPEAAAEAKTPEDEALAAVEAWRRAWSARDAEAYLAAYAPDFEPPRGFATLGDWRAYKKRVIASKSFIKVTLEDALATRQPDGSVSVEFLQHFRSNNFNSDDRKRLLLKKIGPDWKIVREQIL
ncbi:MAG: hypothetical protein D6794_01475 [Deltaproteobacteria bacterium]|nr:MAG: hypothetical protein D6794_01475 [Deltaproteobacteria bacterium]